VALAGAFCSRRRPLPDKIAVRLTAPEDHGWIACSLCVVLPNTDPPIFVPADHTTVKSGSAVAPSSSRTKATLSAASEAADSPALPRGRRSAAAEQPAVPAGLSSVPSPSP